VAYRLELEEGQLVWTTLENGTTIRFNKEPDTSWWKRFSTGFMSIFVPESML